MPSFSTILLLSFLLLIPAGEAQPRPETIGNTATASGGSSNSLQSPFCSHLESCVLKSWVSPKDTIDYDAWGNVIARTGTTTFAYGYRTEEWDPDLGMVYLRARYMNPATGRFHTMDTYEGQDGEPLSLHKFLYANSNPVMGRDPSGMMSVPEVSAVQTNQTNLSASAMTSFARTGKRLVDLFKKTCEFSINIKTKMEQVSSKLGGVYVIGGVDIDRNYVGQGVKVRTRANKSKRHRIGYHPEKADFMIYEFDLPAPKKGSPERAVFDKVLDVFEQGMLSLTGKGKRGPGQVPGNVNEINVIAGGFENIEEVMEILEALCPNKKLPKKLP